MGEVARVHDSVFTESSHEGYAQTFSKVKMIIVLLQKHSYGTATASEHRPHP